MADIDMKTNDTQTTNNNSTEDIKSADNSKLGEEDPKEDVVTLTKKELSELISKQSQSEIDRRVTQAVKTVTDKYEKQLSLSKLDEDKRAVAEKDMRIAELEDQLKEFATMQNKNEVTKTLAARGLSPEFADILIIGDDLEEAQQNIETLDKIFKKCVATEVKKKLASQSKTPSSGEGNPDVALKEEFSKMSLSEQTELYNKNRELYDKLIK